MKLPKAMNYSSLKCLPVLLGSCLVPATASAAITYSTVVDIAIPTTFNGVYLDLNAQTHTSPSNDLPIITDASYTIGYTQPASWDVNFFFGGIGIAYSDTFQPFVDDTVGNRSQILNVAFGTVIKDEADTRTLATPSFGGSGTSNQMSGVSHFVTPSLNDSTYSAFAPGQEGYIAFVLNPGSEQLYGWMRVTLTNDGTPGTIHDWAFSNQTGFTVGMIPEPSTALAGLLLTAGLLRRRRSA